MLLRFLPLITILVCLSEGTSAQNMVDLETTRDSIFAEWDTETTPGMATGIIQAGKATYLKGFGMADVAQGTKNTIETKFGIGALSKQFTSLAMLWLIEQGKIGLNENIRKYLPQLPNYFEPILVKHVLNHTTGLNDYSMVKSLAGWRPNDAFSQDDALSLVCAQKALNFTPGTHFSDIASDTEPTLMAAIISAASGQPFSTFMQENIFKPLGLSHTLVRDDPEKIMEDVATSYHITSEGLRHAIVNLGNFGASNMYISAKDLATWYTYFDVSLDGVANLVKKLDTPVRTDDGRTYDSGWGQMTYGRSFLHAERGIPKYWQFGIVGGYAANVFRFPEQAYTSFVIGNNNRYNGGPAMNSAGLFMEDHYQAPAVVAFDQAAIKELTVEQLSAFEGYYWDNETGFARRIYLEDDTLRYSRIGLDAENAMIPLDDNVFQLVVGSDDVLIATFDLQAADKAYGITAGTSSPSNYVSYEPREYDSDELDEFCGSYYNSALNTIYNFSVSEGVLTASHLKNGQTNFFAIKEDTFRADQEFLRSITFQRTPEGAINGFAVKVRGIVDLKFAKINEEASVN